jgi:hypothetical protein
MSAEIKTITIDGVEYVPSKHMGIANRCVVVVDRGWIFAGDVTDRDGRIYIDRAVHVRAWSSIGFDGMIANPTSNKVTLKKLGSRVDLPADAELFRIPVPDDWGLS